MTWISDTIQRSSFYGLLALVVLVIGAYCCLTLVPENDRLPAIREMMGEGAGIIGQFTTIGSVQPSVVVLVSVLIVALVIVIWQNVQLRTTIRLQNKRIDEMGAEKGNLQKILASLAEKNIFQSSVLSSKEESPMES